MWKQPVDSKLSKYAQCGDNPLSLAHLILRTSLLNDISTSQLTQHLHSISNYPKGHVASACSVRGQEMAPLTDNTCWLVQPMVALHSLGYLH